MLPLRSDDMFVPGYKDSLLAKPAKCRHRTRPDIRGDMTRQSIASAGTHVRAANARTGSRTPSGNWSDEDLAKLVHRGVEEAFFTDLGRWPIWLQRPHAPDRMIARRS